MAKIIGNTTATPYPHSDWNQADETKADYIKNKPVLGALSTKDEVTRTDLSTEIQTSLDKVDDTIQYIDGFATKEYVDDSIAEINISTDVYVAEYGITTFEEIIQAVNEDGKTLLCRVDDGYITLGAVFTLAYCHADGARFIGHTFDGKKEALCSNTGEWSLNDAVDNIDVPVTSVNGKTGDVNLSASDVGADESGTALDLVGLHDNNNTSHSDIRKLISDIEVPTKVSQLTNDKGYLTSFTETDPTVPSWAKQASKPSYSKDDVGLGDVDNVKQYSAENPPPYPVTSVNGKTGAVTISIPNLSGYATETYVKDYAQPKGDYLTSIPLDYVTETELSDKGYATENFVAQKIAEAELSGSDVDLSGYATKDEVESKVDKVKGKSLVDDTEIARLADVDNYDDTELKRLINSKANAADIPTKVSELDNDNNYLTSIPDEYVTEAELNKKGYLTEHQDISNLATKDEVNEKANTSHTHSEYLTSVPNDYKTKTENDSLYQEKGNYLTSYTETDPTVPGWAKEATKPTYTASEVGADAAGTASGQVSAHNTNVSAHNDIRLELKSLADKLNAFLDSDDTTLDELSELITAIKNNQNTISQLTSGKVNVADIINNLTTSATNKPLSAAQGVALKALIDAIVIPTKVSELTNDKGYLISFTETDPTVPSWAKASTKPSYTASEVGALPNTTEIPKALSDLTADSTHRLVTDTEKSTWNNKANTSDIPTKVSQLTNDSGFISSYTETDPTVPSWAKASTKPTYTKSEVGLGNVDNVKQYSASNPPPYPVTKVNGKTGDVALSASDVGAAEKNEGSFFIEGSGTTDSTTKTSTWVGTSDRITEYYDGLSIKYKIGVAGQSTTTLNINGLGAKTVYLFNTTKLTTQFPVKSIINLIYHADLNSGCWVCSDYDSNTNTYQRVYSSTDNIEYPITARYNTTTGSSYYAEYGRYNNEVTLNPSTKTITAAKFKGDLAGNADTATKATQDADGNVITGTYETKTSVASKISEINSQISQLSSEKVDKSNIVQEAGNSESLVMSQKAVTDLVSEAIGTSGGTTEYETVDSIEEMTDTSKQYVLSTDGYIYTYTEKTETVYHEAENKFVESEAQLNKRMGSSSLSAQNGYVWSGAMAVDLTKESPFRVKVEGTKITEPKTGDTDEAYQKLWLCADDSGTSKLSAAVIRLGAETISSHTTLLEDGTIYADYKANAKLSDSIISQTKFIRIGFKFSDSAIANTSALSGVKITFPCEAYTEEITTSAWVSTGMKPESTGGGNYVTLLVKVNENASDIDEIDNRVTALETGSETLTIPSFWTDAVNACISKIKALQVGRNCITFPFFSDNHQRNGYAGMLIAYIMKECNIPYCFYGGDSISNDVVADEATMIEQDKAFDAIMSYVPNGRLCRAVGNHDGYWYDGTNKYWYNREQVYELFLREESIAQNKHFGDNGTYYYVDDIASKVRFIVFNTNVHRDTSGNIVGNNVEAEQISWLQNTALSFNESGWVIVFISHQPISNHYHSNVSNAAEVRTLVSNYINGSSANKADVIGWFSGHIHRDRIYTGIAINTTDDSEGETMPFKQVTITSDHTSIAYDDATKHTVANDDQSHAIDFITINKSTRTVNITRLGIGNDRSYTY